MIAKSYIKKMMPFIVFSFVVVATFCVPYTQNLRQALDATQYPYLSSWNGILFMNTVFYICINAVLFYAIIWRTHMLKNTNEWVHWFCILLIGLLAVQSLMILLVFLMSNGVAFISTLQSISGLFSIYIIYPTALTLLCFHLNLTANKPL